jgi:ubiquinone/menaquinone biosynthesis C-methylase UbiE
MGLYRKYIVPILINASMQNKELAARRRQLVPQARGRVLEVGIGSGLNLPFYGADVVELDGVDPSPELLRRAQRRAKTLALPVRLHEASATQLPFSDGTFETAVMTWTLCSISEPEQALRELRRVLKPSGRLLFVEHGSSPDPGVAKWQRRIEPAWARLSGGCHVSRRMDELIRSAGFLLDDLSTGYLPGPRPFTFTYQGQARVSSPIGAP